MNRRRPGFTLIELIVVIAIISVLIALLLPAVQSARENARRTQCVNNLTQLGLSLQNYETTHTVLPPGTVDSKSPIIESANAYQFGWIAQILPFFDQKAVYRRFDFDQGLYQPANQTARAVKLNVLSCPSDPGAARSGFGAAGSSRFPGITDSATTAYAACYNDIESPITTDNHGVFFLNSHVRLDEIEDGLAHTIFVGEKRGNGDELGWASGTRATLRNTGTPINETYLDSIDFLTAMLPSTDEPPPAEPGARPTPLDEIPPEARPKRPGPVHVGGFGSFHGHGSNFLMGDGSVHYIRTRVNLGIYRLLGSRNDGQLVSDHQY